MSSIATRVLITDGGERAALAAARSLVAAGYEVHVAGPRRLLPALVSRGVRPSVIAVDPLVDPAGYALAIGVLAERISARVVLPVTDASVEALLEHRGSLPASVVLPLPSVDAYLAASDKHGMLVRCREAGLAVPESVTLLTPEDASRLPDAAFFPAFVKPHRSVVSAGPDGRVRQKLAVRLAPDIESCRAQIAALPPGAFPVLVQRPVTGAGEGLFALRWDGRFIADFAHRRLREKPPGGGVSVYRESIAVPPALAAAAHHILEGLDWQGVAMIECKYDAELGRHVFMEVNARLWGSLQLAIDAGVDFPRLLVRAALGEPVPHAAPAAIGVRSRWFWGDVDQLYLRLTRSAESLGLTPTVGGRLAAVREFLTVRPGRDRGEIFRWTDPLPFLVETLQWIGILSRG